MCRDLPRHFRHLLIAKLHLKRKATRMQLRYRPITLAIVLLGLSLTPSRTARADFYAFTGTITSVDDPFGAFSNLATVGAPVSGTFRYSDSADYPDPFQPNPFVTNYVNRREDRPQVTGLELIINGAAQRSSPFSTTNLIVGNDVPGGLPFSPAGDFFRYFDQIPDQYGRQDPLVDYARFDAADSFVIPFASITLSDPIGAAFSSQDLPRGLLPLSAFTDRYGEFSFFDGNGEDINYGSIGFRIDTIRAVPEPGSLTLLACAVVPGTMVWLLRCRSRRLFPEPGKISGENKKIRGHSCSVENL